MRSRALDVCGLDLLCRAEVMDRGEALVGEGGKGIGQPSVLTPDGRRGRTGRRPRGITLEGDGQRQIQDDRHGRPEMLSRDGHQLGSAPVLDVGGIDHRQAAAAQSHGENAMKQIKGVVGGRLGRRVIGDQGSELIRREDLSRGEVGSGEGAFAARGDSDQEDQRVGRQNDGGKSRPTAEVGGRWCGHESGSALGVAVGAHLRVGNRGLRLTGGARKGAAADGRPGFTDEVNFAEMAIRQTPRHVATLLSRGRGHRAGLRLRMLILPEIAPSHKPGTDLAA